MSVDSVRSFFTERGLEDPVFSLDESGATVELASKSMGVEPELIAKTLAFKVKDENILIVTRGDYKIDNKNISSILRQRQRCLSMTKLQR